MQQKQATHWGLGFVIGPGFLDHIQSYMYISDHIATIDLSVPMRNGSTTKCRIINNYSPTSER